MKANKKKRRIGWIIVLSVVVILAAGGTFGWSLLQKEHSEARALQIKDIDFSTLSDGKYSGYYAGGMYGWRENQVQVTVEGGKVADIEILSQKMEIEDVILDELYGSVIDKQSLNVDAVSAATLTSKAYLKSVENALSDD